MSNNWNEDSAFAKVFRNEDEKPKNVKSFRDIFGRVDSQPTDSNGQNKAGVEITSGLSFADAFASIHTPQEARALAKFLIEWADKQEGKK